MARQRANVPALLCLIFAACLKPYACVRSKHDARLHELHDASAEEVSKLVKTKATHEHRATELVETIVIGEVGKFNESEKESSSSVISSAAGGLGSEGAKVNESAKTKSMPEFEEIRRSFHNAETEYQDGKCPLTGDYANKGCGFGGAVCSCQLGPAMYCYHPSWSTLASRWWKSEDVTQADWEASVVGHCTIKPWVWVTLAVLVVLLLGGIVSAACACCKK
eukprot:TRINITY_DN29834_c0_g1_i1.p1 TRINITY_DN29834_c0_g1~~TRINITY_DN29834_c0_g1_i1.p1  ORF type:complete len:222 (+),score=37.18 TRINITY_DN29834_c0_g1_i1:82-747(+)